MVCAYVCVCVCLLVCLCLFSFVSMAATQHNAWYASMSVCVSRTQSGFCECCVCICDVVPQLGCEVHGLRWFGCISAILCFCECCVRICRGVLRVSTFACRCITCAMFPAFVTVTRRFCRFLVVRLFGGTHFLSCFCLRSLRYSTCCHCVAFVLVCLCVVLGLCCGLVIVVAWLRLLLALLSPCGFYHVVFLNRGWSCLVSRCSKTVSSGKEATG